MFRKRLQLFCLLAAVAAVVGGVHVARTAEQEQKLPELSKTLRKYDLLKLDAKSAVSQIRRNGKLLLKTSHGVFDLQLFPHDLRSSDYRSQAIGPDGMPRRLPSTSTNTYKGFARDLSGAQVRLTITDNSIEGAIITNTDRYFIQPARSLSKTASEDEFVVYNAQDVNQEAWQCGVTLADQVAAQTHVSSNVHPLNPQKVVRLATEADAEYVAALGGPTQANNHILSILNQVDGIYQVEVGLTFQVVFQNAWTNAATDPYASTNASEALEEFRHYWNANFTSTQRNVAHFWSGKILTGALGLANIATVCRTSEAYSLTQRLPDDPANPITAITIIVTAHELAHNFGASHTNVLPSKQQPLEIDEYCRDTIMQAGVFTGVTFCEFSRSQILSFVTDSATCLSDAATPPVAFPDCVDVPIQPGIPVNGALTTMDCRSPSRGVAFYADRYSFQGQAGQRLSITMTVTTPGLDPELYLIGPDGSVVAHESYLFNSARLPATGSVTLPDTGKYTIEATSFTMQQTGSYTLALSLDDCLLSVNPQAAHFGTSGGSGTINVTATGSGCASSYQFTVWPNTASWLTTRSSNGAGSQTLSFDVKANSTAAGRAAFLVVGASFGKFAGGLHIPITQSGSTPDCVLAPIGFGETIDGVLSTTDCRSPNVDDAQFYADPYVFTAAGGEEIAIIGSRPAGPLVLTLVGPNGRTILTGIADAPSKARIPGGPGMLKLGLPGQYVIEVTIPLSGETGPYSLTLLTNAPPVLLARDNGDRAVALQSVSFLTEPFPLTTTFNLSPDQQTRVMLFASNLGLLPGEVQSAVTAVAEDGQMNSYPLTVEFVGKVPGQGWMSEIVLKLPPNLPSGQDVRVSIAIHGRLSNKVRLAIR